MRRYCLLVCFAVLAALPAQAGTIAFSETFDTRASVAGSNWLHHGRFGMAKVERRTGDLVIDTGVDLTGKTATLSVDLVFSAGNNLWDGPGMRDGHDYFEIYARGSEDSDWALLGAYDGANAHAFVNRFDPADVLAGERHGRAAHTLTFSMSEQWPSVHLRFKGHSSRYGENLFMDNIQLTVADEQQPFGFQLGGVDDETAAVSTPGTLAVMLSGMLMFWAVRRARPDPARPDPARPAPVRD